MIEADASRENRRVNFVDFPHETNLNYRYSSAEDLLQDKDTLMKMIQDHHNVQCERLAVLDDYYKAKNTNILKNERRIEKEKADHRPAHNFAKIGCQFDVGYNTGIPVKFESEHESTQELVAEFNDLNDVDGLHSELWLDMDKYGRAYELHYRDDELIDNVVISNVFETFVVYDTTVKRNPILAVRYPKESFGDDIHVTVYTADRIIEYNKTSLSGIEFHVKNERAHSYGMVPILEVQPNRYRQGLYEDVLSLIDLYDASQADTANYMSDMSNAILVIQGDVDSSGMTNEDLIAQKKAGILVLESGIDVNGNNTQLAAGYIYKQYDVAGTEAYKKRLVSDIHKIMNVPDLSDENFSGVQSGEAMKYKLFGFTQMTSTKRRLFDKHLRRRYKLLYNIKKYNSEISEEEVDQMVITFTSNLPKAIKEELEMLASAGVEFSQETLLGLASFVESAQDELDKLNAQNENPPQFDMER